jgi:hypothetical protein
MTHSCNHCKTEFRQKRRNQFYCNQSCRQLAYVTRKYAGNAAPNKGNIVPPGFDLAGLLGNMKPEMLMQLLIGAVNNPSMTDKLTDKSDKPVNTHAPSQNPSQNVNDEMAKNYKKEPVFVQKHDENTSENGLNSLNTESKLQRTKTFDLMLHHGLTLLIGPAGFVRSAFPHWNEREWELSRQINKKMVSVFHQLVKASDKKSADMQRLRSVHDAMIDIQAGSTSFCLPVDYPFKQFLLLLTTRLGAVIADAGDKKKIKFRVPDDLCEMMRIVEIQVREE